MPARAASRGRRTCSPRTHWARLVASTGTGTVGMPSLQGPGLPAGSRLTNGVTRLPPEDFDHGAPRNLGASLAGGDVLVFISQDAYPVDTQWLARLVAPLAGDSDVAGVYGRQLAHEDAKPPERYFMDFLYGDE